jgi:hypothetical protein
MAITRQIPVVDWVSFLREFNGRNYARPVHLQLTALPERGAPVLAKHEPLVGVELDPKGSEAPAITVALGGLAAHDPQFTHLISEPTRMWVVEEPRGLTVGLNIESKGEGQTVLIFEPALV